MKNIVLFVKSSVKRNPVAIFLVFITVFILCIVTMFSIENFGSFSMKLMKVAVIDNDKSKTSEAIIEYFTDDLGIEVTVGEDYNIFANELIERTISVIIEIPSDLENDGIHEEMKDLEITSLDDYTNVAFIEVYIDSFLQSIDMLMKSASGDFGTYIKMLEGLEVEQMSIASDSAYITDDSRIDAINGVVSAAGFYSMFIFFIGMSMAFLILEDRNSGIFERIKVTPAKVGQYLLGNSLYTILMGSLPVLFYVYYLKKVGMVEVVPYPILIADLIIFNLVSISFCMMSVMFCKNRATLLTVVVGFSSIAPILGGAYWPLGDGAGFLNSLSKTVPQYWFIQLLRDITESKPIHIWSNFGILLLYVLLFILIAAGKFMQKEKGRILG